MMRRIGYRAVGAVENLGKKCEARSYVLNVDDLAIRVESETFPLYGCFDRTFGFEYFVKFLELGFCEYAGVGSGERVTYCAVLCFWDPEKDYCCLDTAPYGEDDVGLPSYLLERNRPRELIQESG
jgi:hypothetical protein